MWEGGLGIEPPTPQFVIDPLHLLSLGPKEICAGSPGQLQGDSLPQWPLLSLMDGGIAERVVGKKSKGCEEGREKRWGLKERVDSRLGKDERESMREERDRWRDRDLGRLRC
ncbi:unnamed protein product [Pleuronectes platessa]|uniref:Uncharacterized protein n=1 Tax=Pleuronectes platessa TaxID=8262 RepID=A0A9N7TGT9_PLEPL|nr:unnamed protein product [Pleuronectes platessa]